ncbi:SURF1 family cytochrome oxidase biogenesis protein [Pseudobowmanella zhangzhouensis]|uniref:SURF1 family cytochrome oxidase biogenesis protein n=1 Tax=Pseudobowmanella zhangzhouensis TaxID=1537679 RepID=UPI00361D8498
MAQSGTARDALPDFHLPDGLITLNGRVGEPSLNSFIRETASGAQPGLVRVQQFDPVWIEQHYQLQVLPLMLYVTEPGELRRDWQPVVMPPEKHLAYAIQWFGIALAILIIFFFAVRRTLSNESE